MTEPDRIARGRSHGYHLLTNVPRAHTCYRASNLRSPGPGPRLSERAAPPGVETLAGLLYPGGMEGTEGDRGGPGAGRGPDGGPRGGAALGLARVLLCALAVGAGCGSRERHPGAVRGRPARQDAARVQAPTAVGQAALPGASPPGRRCPGLVDEACAGLNGARCQALRQAVLRGDGGGEPTCAALREDPALWGRLLAGRDAGAPGMTGAGALGAACQRVRDRACRAAPALCPDVSARMLETLRGSRGEVRCRAALEAPGGLEATLERVQRLGARRAVARAASMGHNPGSQEGAAVPRDARP